MYEVTRTKSELIVKGPNNYVKVLDPDSVGIVIRASLHWPDDEPVAYAVRCGDMTKAEIVGQALELNSYPL